MATIIKEKRREKKKKPKEKPLPLKSEEPKLMARHEPNEDESSCALVQTFVEPTALTNDCEALTSQNLHYNDEESKDTLCRIQNVETGSLLLETPIANTQDHNIYEKDKSSELEETTTESVSTSINFLDHKIGYKDLNTKLKNIHISYETAMTDEANIEVNSSVEATGSMMRDMEPVTEDIPEVVCPSAPIFHEPHMEELQHEQAIRQAATKESRPIEQAMPLEEAARLFGGAEMGEVRAMSEREEAKVNAGPLSGPEHPLVDLLCTFRCSLKAVDRERLQLHRGFIEEEKSRSQLWKIEKRSVNIKESCGCGSNVTVTVNYEHAELMKVKIPAAKLRLEGLLRDAQHSYCHHQHSALLAHCQIEQLLSETIQTNKQNIREALSLILKELRLTDIGISVLSSTLQRWAAALTAALLDGRDLRQLLFLMHHLCKQNRSVHWVAGLIQLPASDSVEVARAIALLDLLFTSDRVDAARECIEDSEDAWEEVDQHGSGGAVSDGALRERDLLALFRAFPIGEMLATLALFRHRDLTQTADYQWGDVTGGRGLLKAACGTRLLIAALHRAVSARSAYRRLAAEAVEAALTAARALLYLWEHSRDYITPALSAQVSAELECVFSCSWRLVVLSRAPLCRLPARLLGRRAADDCMLAAVAELHETTTKPIEGVDVELPGHVACDERVNFAAQLAVDRGDHHELACHVVEFLLQTALKKKPPSCKGSCEAAARDSLPRVLAAHPYLYSNAFHLLGTIFLADNIPASSVALLAPHQWRPSPHEVVIVLAHYAATSPALLPPLLLSVECTPHVGLSLPTQLAIACWICDAHDAALPAPEWTWRVMRRLRIHRVLWGFPVDAPPPDKDGGILRDAFNLLATSWGHCVPLICADGVGALLRIAESRPRDAAHCLSLLMLVMAQAPESVALTPKFAEVFSTLLGSGPTFLQRALGRGGECGADLLTKIMLLQLRHTCALLHVSAQSVQSAWLCGLWGRDAAGSALCEVALVAVNTPVNEYIVQELNTPEKLAVLLRHASLAPCACACALQSARSAQDATWRALLCALQAARAQRARVHVDNTLKALNTSLTSEELVIHRTAAALLAAPMTSPGHLMLWRMFFCMYLQRPPNDPRETTPPVGPILFSGVYKTRTLAQLKRRIQEGIAHHRAEAEKLREKHDQVQPDGSPMPKDSKHKQKTEPSTDRETDLLPSLTLSDLTGEPVESDDSSDDQSREPSASVEGDAAFGRRLQDALDLLAYHINAEVKLKKYHVWLEAGDCVRALPHEVEAVHERLYEAACRAELDRLQPAASPADEELAMFPDAAPPPEPPKTPFQKAVEMLRDYQTRAQRRSRRITMKSPVEEMDLKNPRALLSAVDRHLREMDSFAKEWHTAVSRLVALDAGLWQLVAGLRVASAIPPVKKKCANKCKPVALIVPADEWCVSTGAERGIKENRSSARAALRRLARPMPNAAKTAAALQTIARHVRSVETATAILDRVWQFSSDARIDSCACTKLALTSLASELAEKWVSHDATLCAGFLKRWLSRSAPDRSTLRQALVAALIAPRRLRREDWTTVYVELLRHTQSGQFTFSLLSKFEMRRWSDVAAPEQRMEVLEALVSAMQRPAGETDASHHMLLELLGVHMAALLDARTLPRVALLLAVASAHGSLRPALWAHLLHAAEALAAGVAFDELGHTLRQLGALWWQARTDTPPADTSTHARYAASVAKLLRTLLLAFVAAAQATQQHGDRAAWYAWSALHEAWSPWLLPRVGASWLLRGDSATYMLQQFRGDVAAVMHECAGSEPFILQEICNWAGQLPPTCNAQWTQDDKRQLTALLAELAKLPWAEHQWFSYRCMQALVQVSASGDAISMVWMSDILRATLAPTWCVGVIDEHLSPHLTTLFCVLTSMPLQNETLEEATKLPWWRLPGAGLDSALDRFFADHYSVTTSYHSLPQFKIVLYASELSAHPTINTFAARPGASEKRLSAVSFYVRAASAPALHEHVGDATACLLDVLTKIAPLLPSEEMVALLSRAITILCTEPAGTTSLRAWQKWVASTNASMIAACLSAVVTLTTFDHYAALADTAIRAYMVVADSEGWPGVLSRWQGSHWRDPLPLVSRCRLHVAYVTSLLAGDLRAVLRALPTVPINFESDDAIVAVWICLAGRIAAGNSSESESVPESESESAARALLARWGEARPSLLKTLTMQGNQDVPTNKHRQLCRFAQRVSTPTAEASLREYSSLCAAAGLRADVTSFTREPRRWLTRLAAALYADCESYFQVEIECGSGS